MTITFINYFTDGYVWKDLFYVLNHNRVGKLRKKKYASTRRELSLLHTSDVSANAIATQKKSSVKREKHNRKRKKKENFVFLVLVLGLRLRLRLCQKSSSVNRQNVSAPRPTPTPPPHCPGYKRKMLNGQLFSNALADVRLASCVKSPVN